jgi:hypothetical protein
MSRKVTAIDNAVMKYYFHIFKAEATHGQNFNNQKRLHSSLVFNMGGIDN